LFRAKTLLENFQHIVYIKPCGKEHDEKCYPEIQGDSNSLNSLLKMDHPPTLSEGDFKRLQSKLMVQDETGYTPFHLAILYNNKDFIQGALDFAFKNKLATELLEKEYIQKLPIGVSGTPINLGKFKTFAAGINNEAAITALKLIQEFQNGTYRTASQ
jgi:hypothetical protein